MKYKTEKRICPKCGEEIGTAKRLTLLNAICLFIGRLVVIFALFTALKYVLIWLSDLCSGGFNVAYRFIADNFLPLLIIVAIAAVISILSNEFKQRKIQTEDNEEVMASDCAEEVVTDEQY